MSKSWPSPERWAFPYRLNLAERLWRMAAARSPAAFRRPLFVSAEADGPFQQIAQPWQQRDLEQLDPAWRSLAGHAVSVPYRRAWLERPRGHAKTSDMALQITWILLFSRRPVLGVAAAADREQASLIRSAVAQLVRLNRRLLGELDFRQHAVLNPNTGSRLEIVSSDVQSSWGILPDFVICDELCHWEKEEMWHSLLSSAAKKPHGVLVVLTNAGVGRGWQWELREAARQSDRWYFSSLRGSQAPWITDDWLDEQRRLLPASVFERLWNNVWQDSEGEFVTLAEAEACRDPHLQPQERGQPHYHYVAAVDYAEKHDYTVGVLVHYDGSRIVVDRMDVVVPQPHSPVRIEWVEQWMERVMRHFPRVTFVLDEYQLAGTIQRFTGLGDVRRFRFAAGRGNHRLALSLRKLILHRELAWYPGCGQLPDTAQRDDLETELASLLLRQTPAGLCRIDHRREARFHDDRAFALGAACLTLLDESIGLPAGEWLSITPPTQEGDLRWW